MSEKLDPDSVRRAVRSRVAAQRDRHKRRPLALRVVSAAAGAACALVGVLLLWAPEFGVPLLIVGLGLLALEFDWAVGARAWVEWRSAILRDRVKRAPAGVKLAVVVVVAALLIVAAWSLWATYS